ncbi:hypothetical protein QTP86_016465 [Hemibagrus guttatus]|nr:hypothetical protein QTP86_016465 [Hemibagrus guttatus]
MEFVELIKTPRVDGVVLHRPFLPTVEGTLCLTGHHLILSSRQDNTEELWLLHANIDAIEKRRPGGGAGFKLFYYGVDSKRNGVGVVLKEEFVRNVLEVKRVSDRVMSLKLEIEGVMLNVVSGYAPQVGCELEEKERFWSELDEVMESIPTGERVVIGADFNGHVGEGNTGDEEVMGKFGVKERNLEGQMVVDFVKRMDMGVVNTYFQKREEHRVTYKSGGRSTQVDCILCRRGNLKEISDCKVVVGESVARQHRMVVCRMTLMVCKKKRSEIEKKTKWWKLKKEECCEEFRQKLRQALGGQVVLPDDWETTAEVIRETGRKVLGVSSGRRKEDKETWWWNEEVQDSIQRKRLAKKKWDLDRTEENRQEYKELQRRVKREVSKAKQKAYDELYTRLDTREGQKDLYRLARQSDRDGKDVQQVRVIKDRDGRVLTSEESVQRRWKEYFEELMNEENEREKRVEGVNSVEQKVDKIRKDEVRKALKRMKNGKAVGPDDIPVEVWKCLGLASLFNRVLENLEKVYDRVPREELWYCMRKSGVAEKYVRVVQDMYERSRTVVRCAVGQTEKFKVEVGLHQGSALSPFLFAIVMDQLSEEVRQESPWTMMFTDDIVICSESREQVEQNLERWRFALERRGMKVSRSKTEYMCVNEREGSGTVRLQGEEVKKAQEFKYLGSTVQSSGECGIEVKKRVQAGWNGWRKVSGVLCDRKISARIKGKVYRTVVRPAMLYGLETVSLRKIQESELEVAELKMLRFVGSLGSITVKCKDLRIIHLDIPGMEECFNIASSIEALSTLDSVSLMYPFFYRPMFEVIDDGWRLYSPDEAFKDLESMTDEWRLSEVNKDFNVCPSYPSLVAVPKDIDDDTLCKAAAFRHGGRFPVLSYYHKKNGMVMMRAGQPLTSTSGRRCKEDEKLINATLRAGKRGYIIDTRTLAVAQQAKTRGGGYEHEANYPQWRRINKAIERYNILQESLIKLVEACNDHSNSMDRWLSKLEASNWQSHVKEILTTACLAAQCIDREGASVLVHGTEGTDSTLQVTSLAQIILDPGCRTVRGFQALIEREWLQAGHPFQQRCSQSAYSNGKPRSEAPVFLLFLDCVWQILRQFPCSFEFNELFLVTLFEHAYASQFGTFLGNSTAERVKLELCQKTVSLWSWMNRPKELERFLNPLYEANSLVIWPSVAPQSLLLWEDVFLRWNRSTKCLDEAYEEMVHIIEYNKELQNKVNSLRRQLAQLETEDGPLQSP